MQVWILESTSPLTRQLVNRKQLAIWCKQDHSPPRSFNHKLMLPLKATLQLSHLQKNTRLAVSSTSKVSPFNTFLTFFSSTFVIHVIFFFYLFCI
ncbi:hypothetical protein POPTR_008G005850v4 [Populus trichocarpa]|uniref:Uncharacterized protein n=1 Tax=Populus trichocarpa TaxID=3694 RepID=A0ACC0SIS4_POPTR|nr:hypothetical protein BDE02_08G003500 [Populus trichocarpa]KAI9389137.1 hypothetical protein POPTR_008G005850v4 [Populus trichocarpa]